MFADPQTVTINSVAKVLNRVNQDGYGSTYLLRTSTEEYRLTIRNTTYVDKKRAVSIDRHNVEFTQTIFPVAPATLSTVRKYYVVIENQQGDALAGATLLAGALNDWLNASSYAAITKLLNYES